MQPHRIDVPGVGVLEITEPAILGPLRVRHQGQPVSAKRWWSPVFGLQGAAGPVEVTIRQSLFRGGVDLTGPDFTLHAGPDHSVWLGALTYVPFALAGVGGALGGLLGGVGWLVNRRIAALHWPMPARVVLIVLVTVVTALAWAVARAALLGSLA